MAKYKTLEEVKECLWLAIDKIQEQDSMGARSEIAYSIAILDKMVEQGKLIEVENETT